MGRVLASTQRWIGQTASIDALNCDIGADRDFGFHRDTSAPRPDEGRGAAATGLILVLRPIWWKSEMTKLSLRSWHLEQPQHRTNGVPKVDMPRGLGACRLTENDPRVNRRADWRSSAGEPIDSRRNPILRSNRR